MIQNLKLGVYEHYSGKQYDVIGVARHSETLENMVIYQARYGENEIWVRPYDMFLETVEIDDNEVPRFKLIKE